MIITEQEKNRILNIHRTSKNVNGVLISEQQELRAVYFVRVGFETQKALKAANTKDKGAYDFGTGQNIWWKASHPDTYTAEDIRKWNVKYPYGDSKKYIRIKTDTQKEFYWEMGPFSSKDKAITAQEEWEDYTWGDAKLIKRCGSGPNLSSYKTIAMDQECGKTKGDVATETETEFPNLELSDSLDLQNMPTFDPNKEGIVYTCSMDGCAAYVSDVLGGLYQGNAWHAHRMENNVYSSFENAGTRQNNAITNLFNKINRNPRPKKEISDAKNITKSLVPNQQKFSNLELNDVVGLFYEPSEMHDTAFFEAMTGFDEMGKGSKAGDGPFMIKADGSGQWSKEDVGKDIKFKPGKTLSKGMVPGLNTHLGFVGAINNGEPIIFHNIHQKVYATPLSEMDKNGTAIVWAKRGQQTTGKKEVEKGTVDKMKDDFMYYFNKIKDKL